MYPPPSTTLGTLHLGDGQQLKLNMRSPCGSTEITARALEIPKQIDDKIHILEILDLLMLNLKLPQTSPCIVGTWLSSELKVSKWASGQT